MDAYLRDRAEKLGANVINGLMMRMEQPGQLAAAYAVWRPADAVIQPVMLESTLHGGDLCHARTCLYIYRTGQQRGVLQVVYLLAVCQRTGCMPCLNNRPAMKRCFSVSVSGSLPNLLRAAK